MIQRLVVADVADDAEGRGLLLLSALYMAMPALARVARFRLLRGHDTVLRAATEILAWDTGLQIDVEPADNPAEALEGATLFAAIAATGTAHLPLAQAASLGVPALVAVQFPDAAAGPATLALTRAAHDPRAFAARLLAALDTA